MASRFHYKARCWIIWVTGTGLARYFHTVKCADLLRLTADFACQLRHHVDLEQCRCIYCREAAHINAITEQERLRGLSRTKIWRLTVDARMTILNCRTARCGDAGSRCWIMVSYALSKSEVRARRVTGRRFKSPKPEIFDLKSSNGEGSLETGFTSREQLLLTELLKLRHAMSSSSAGHYPSTCMS